MALLLSQITPSNSAGKSAAKCSSIPAQNKIAPYFAYYARREREKGNTRMKFLPLNLAYVFALIFACGVAHSASLSSITPTICTNGYSDDGSTCTTYDVGDCGAGYYELENNTSTTIAPNGSTCQVANYRPATIDSATFTLTYHGMLVGSTVDNLCTNGYSDDGSTCKTYGAGDCASGNYELTYNTSTTVAPNGSVCQVVNYKPKTVDNSVSLTYHGLLVGSTVDNLCTNGYSADGSTCTTYTAGYCPNGYYSLSNNPSTFTDYTTSCASNYSQYSAESFCKYTTTTSYCLDVCGNGQYTTEFGTCASLCTAGATTLRTSNGILLPIWSSSQRTPSLNIGIGNDVCYVNLDTGTASETTLMFDVGGTTYHAVQ